MVGAQPPQVPEERAAAALLPLLSSLRPGYYSVLVSQSHPTLCHLVSQLCFFPVP